MSLEIFLIIFFSIVLFSRIIFSKKYRIYYLVTAFFSLRLWMAILASFYYATGNVYMDEIEEFTQYSINTTMTLFLIASIFLIMESFALKYITYQYNKNLNTPNNNFYFQFTYLFSVIFILVNTYLAIETISAFDPITANKMVFVNFTHAPILYKLLDLLSLFLLVCIAYSVSLNKYYENKSYFNPSIIYPLIIIGISLFAFRFIYIHAKSPFMVMLLLYCIAPMYLFSYVFKFKFLKNKSALISVVIFSMIIILFTFYTHYGSGFLDKIGERVLLEGQLLYSSIDYFYSNSVLPSFITHFPGNDDESKGMVYMMEIFLPSHKLEQFYNTGWQMSGTLPALNFMFNDIWIAYIYWFMNWVFFIFLISKGLKTFLQGQLVRTFIYFNVAFLVGFFYLILGNNYLFSYRFWILLVLLIFIELISKISQQKKLTTSQGII